MKTNEAPQPGITFYATDKEQYFKILDIQTALTKAGIETRWNSKEWYGNHYPALDVFSDGNTVANYLRSEKKD